MLGCCWSTRRTAGADLASRLPLDNFPLPLRLGPDTMAVLVICDLVELALSSLEQFIWAWSGRVREVELSVLSIDVGVQLLFDIESRASVVSLHSSWFPALSPAWQR